MIANKFTTSDANRREEPVIGGGGDEGGASSEEGDVEGPQVFEWGADREEVLKRNERVVGVGAPIEGGNCLTNEFFEGVVKFRRKNKKKKMVRKKRDNKNVNKEDTRGDRKRGRNKRGGRETRESLFEGGIEDVRQGDIPANNNAKMGGSRAEWEVGPGAICDVREELGKGPVSS